MWYARLRDLANGDVPPYLTFRSAAMSKRYYLPMPNTTNLPTKPCQELILKVNVIVNREHRCNPNLRYVKVTVTLEGCHLTGLYQCKAKPVVKGRVRPPIRYLQIPRTIRLYESSHDLPIVTEQE